VLRILKYFRVGKLLYLVLLCTGLFFALPVSFKVSAVSEKISVDEIPDPNISELISYLNDDRVSYGLPPLKGDPALTRAAYAKAMDMVEKDYWDHDGPNGETAWQFIVAEGYDYMYVGENLAKGFYDPVDIESEWMKSPNHKAALLEPNFKDVGIGFMRGEIGGEETIIVVEFFGIRKSEFSGTLLPSVINKNNSISSPLITSPKNKSYFNSLDVDINAFVPIGDQVRLFSNNQFITEFPRPSSDLKITASVFDYKNIIYLVSKAKVKENFLMSNPSNKIYVTVDTAKPNIQNIRIQTVKSQDWLELHIQSKEDLSRVLYRLDIDEGILNRINANSFVIRFRLGDFKSKNIKLFFADLAGNVTSENYIFPLEFVNLQNSTFPVSFATDSIVLSIGLWICTASLFTPLIYSTRTKII
jgi:hypothetical protein